MLFPREVGDAETAAEIQEAHRGRRRPGEAQGEFKTLDLRFSDRLGAQVLRAGKEVEALKSQAVAANLGEQVGDLLRVHAKLPGAATHLHPRALQLEIRVDAHGNACCTACLMADRRQLGDFAKRLDVDQDAGGNRLGQLGASLARSGKTDLAWIRSGVESDFQFARRGHVDSIHQSCHVTDQGRHRVRLHGVVQLQRRWQGRAQQRDPAREQLPVVGVERRLADARGESRQRDATNQQLAVLDRELAHRRVSGYCAVGFVHLPVPGGHAAVARLSGTGDAFARNSLASALRSILPLGLRGKGPWRTRMFSGTM